MDIRYIQNAIQRGNIRVSTHAKIEIGLDNFDLDDILYSVMNGEIIEDYPEDRLSPSCLICGYVYDGRPAHSVWGYIKQNEVAVCITAYFPNQDKWMPDNRTRRY
jgi:rubredoxin